MAETASSTQIVEQLNKVMRVDFDAIIAYKAAIDRLSNDHTKDQLRRFMGDHEAHIQQLAQFVRQAGGEPAKGGDVMAFVTKGQVLIGSMFSALVGDKAILMAMKMNEDTTNKTYEKAYGGDFPDDIAQFLERGLADERRHRAWIQDALKGHASE